VDEEKVETMEVIETLVFENVKLFDDNGLPIGCHPICDDDWEYIDISHEKILEWMAEQKSNAVSTDNINLFAVYPNPFNDIQSFAIQSPQEYLLKLEILDEDRNSYLQFSQIISKDYFNLSFNYENLGMENSKLYRVYYKILNANNSIIYQGYGDIFGCDIPTDYLSCYPK
jgi:hypothetical protein